MTSPLHTDRIRFVGLLKKKDGITKEEFTRRWLLHGELFKTTELSRKILKYEQHHIDESVNAMLKQLGTVTTEYDGMSIMEAESFEVFEFLQTSEEYAQVLKPDEEEFMDREKTMVIPMHFGTFVDRT